MDDLSDSFKQQIYGEFEALLRGEPADDASRDAAYVIDALGSGVKEDFVQWFATRQLGDYGTAFAPGSEGYALEQTPRRFEWCVRLFEAYDERWRDVFPTPWSMDERLAEEFCSQTKLALAANLQQNRATLDVAALLAALRATLAFEALLCQRFRVHDDEAEAEAAKAAAAAKAGVDRRHGQDGHSSDSDDNSDGGDKQADGDDGGDEARAALAAANPHSAAAVRLRYEQFQRERRRAERAAAKARAAAKRREEKFAGMISSAFDPYLDLYVSREDAELADVMARLIAADAPSDKRKGDGDADDARAPPPPSSSFSGGLQVLPSATDLVYVFKKCRTRCAALNRGQTLYEIFGLFRQYLSKYASHLTAQLPSDDAPLNANDEDALQRLTTVINTADYW